MASYEAAINAQAAVALAWLSLRAVTRWLWPTGPSAEYPQDATPAWASRVLGAPVASVTVDDLAANRGLVGAMFRVGVTYAGGPTTAPPHLVARPTSFILKSTRAATRAQVRFSISRVAAREARAYALLAARGSPLPPALLWSRSSLWSGECALLLEDVGARPGGGAVGVNLLLGNQVWGLPAPLPRPVDPLTVMTTAAVAAADLHAAHWRDASLPAAHPWLKAADWYAGRGRAAWEGGLNAARARWAAGKASPAVASGQVALEPWVVALVDASLAGATWGALQARLADPAVPWTLTHGDWHASNMLWCYRDDLSAAPHAAAAGAEAAAAPVAAADPRRLAVVDWSEAGLWEGTADVAQMMISDVPPPVRRACEQRVLRAYWARLNAGAPPGATGVDWDTVWAGYATRGAERWVWMLALLAGFGLPPAAMQYFHDQVAAFVRDYCRDPATGALPRALPVTSLVTIVL